MTTVVPHLRFAVPPAADTRAQRLERLASDLHAVAFDFAEPSRSVRESDRRTAEVERICAEARAVVRGG